jgi:hypothetical protein
MYCGKELKKDEKCDCRQSNIHRANATDNNSSEKKKKSKTASKVKFKKVRDNRYFDKENIMSRMKSLIFSFLRDPVYTVSNPGNADRTESIILIALQGIVFSLITFFSYSGMKRSMLSILVNAVGLKGVGGFKNIGLLLLSMISVTIFNFILYFIITGIFYLESRYLFKSRAEFWDIAVRFAISTLPVTLIGLVGIVISLFSMTTVFTLLIAGMISAIILNYEGLNSVWNFSPSRTMYIIASGYFIYLGIVYNLVVAVLS